MQIQALSVKVFAEAGRGYDPEALIAVFHGWIREKKWPDLLLIDVADYRHVVDGPGVMVIANECHFGIDEDGGAGLLYSRKRDPLGDAGDKLRQAFRDVLAMCRALEQDERIPLVFRPGELEVRIMSRLAAPNDTNTFAEFRPPLSEFLTELYGHSEFAIEHLHAPAEAFGVRVRAGVDSLSALSELWNGDDNA